MDRRCDATDSQSQRALYVYTYRSCICYVCVCLCLSRREKQSTLGSDKRPAAHTRRQAHTSDVRSAPIRDLCPFFFSPRSSRIISNHSTHTHTHTPPALFLVPVPTGAHARTWIPWARRHYIDSPMSSTGFWPFPSRDSIQLRMYTSHRRKDTSHIISFISFVFSGLSPPLVFSFLLE